MTLTEPTSGEFLLTTKRGIEFHFADSTHQQLTSISDPNGNSLSFTYDGQGRLTAVTDAGGRSYTLSYDTDGRVSQLTDTALTRSYSFEYDASGRLTGITDPLGDTERFGSDAENLLTGITDRRGDTATIAYVTPLADANTRLPKDVTKAGSTVTFDYDPLTRTTTVTDPNGNSWKYAYDEAGHVTTVTDPDLKVIRFTWDSDENLLSSTDRNGGTTSSTYDDVGNMLTRTDALGESSSATYEPTFSRLLTATDRTGNTRTHAYDANANRTESTNPLGQSIVRTFDASGQMTARTDRNGNTTTSNYDTDGNLITFTDPLENQTQYTYDDGSRLTELTDANGAITRFEYDALDRLTVTTDALGNADDRAYDADGNPTTYTDRRGNDWTETSDPLGRLTSRTNPNPENPTWQYDYDPAGNLVTHTDAKGQVTTNTYNALGRLVSQTYPDSEASYTYDAEGNLLTAADDASDYSYVYDRLNRVTEVIDNVRLTSVLSTYDAEGRLSSRTLPGGTKVEYAYDAAGRLISTTEPTGTSTMTYDAEGNLVTDTRSNGVITTITVNANNQPLSITHIGPSGEGLLRFTYTYDNVGQVVRTELETPVAPGPSAPGAADRGPVIFGNTAVHELEWDPRGQPIREVFNGEGFAGSEQNFTYDPNEGRIRIVRDIADGPISETNFILNPAGSVIESDDGTFIFTFNRNENDTLTMKDGTDEIGSIRITEELEINGRNHPNMITSTLTIGGVITTETEKIEFSVLNQAIEFTFESTATAESIVKQDLFVGSTRVYEVEGDTETEFFVNPPSTDDLPCSVHGLLDPTNPPLPVFPGDQGLFFPDNLGRVCTCPDRFHVEDHFDNLSGLRNLVSPRFPEEGSDGLFLSLVEEPGTGTGFDWENVQPRLGVSPVASETCLCHDCLRQLYFSDRPTVHSAIINGTASFQFLLGGLNEDNTVTTVINESGDNVGQSLHDILNRPLVEFSVSSNFADVLGNPSDVLTDKLGHDYLSGSLGTIFFGNPLQPVNPGGIRGNSTPALPLRLRVRNWGNPRNVRFGVRLGF